MVKTHCEDDLLHGERSPNTGVSVGIRWQSDAEDTTYETGGQPQEGVGKTKQGIFGFPESCLCDIGQLPLFMQVLKGEQASPRVPRLPEQPHFSCFC